MKTDELSEEREGRKADSKTPGGDGWREEEREPRLEHPQHQVIASGQPLSWQSFAICVKSRAAEIND